MLSLLDVFILFFFFFFKQKTAYEMRISDWSSDVCSSDLLFNDMLDFLDLLPGAFPRIDIGDVDDGFFGWVQHGKDVVGVSAGIEEIADVEQFQILVAV